MMQEAEAFCAESGANNAKMGPRTLLLSIMRSTLLMNCWNMTRGDDKEKIEAAVQKTLDLLGEDQLDSLFEGSDYAYSLSRASFRD